MAFNTRDWLKELGFTETEILDLEPKFQTRAEQLEKHQLRQSDYSRKMNEITELQGKVKESNDRLTAEMAEWAELKGQDESEAAKMKTDLDKLRIEHFALTEKLKDVATKAGIDPTTLLPKDPPKEPVKEPVAPAFDPKPLLEQMGGISNYLLTLNAEIPMIAEEHYALTGERLDTRGLIADIKARAAKKEDIDPVKLWETKYDIPAKRQAKADKQRKDDLKAAEDRGYERARSEAAIPGQQSPGTHAPIFSRPDSSGQRPVSKLQRPQPGTNTAHFAEALAKGTYRQPVLKKAG